MVRKKSKDTELLKLLTQMAKLIKVSWPLIIITEVLHYLEIA